MNHLQRATSEPSRASTSGEKIAGLSPIPKEKGKNEGTCANDRWYIDTIREIIQQETQIVLRQARNCSQIGDELDEKIDLFMNKNLVGMNKIPDVVKRIRNFSGEPGEYGSWRKSVERILNIYSHIKGSPKYFGILTTIRNKITGAADVALEAYNTPLNWERIIKCLNLHYADKRDAGTLEHQMTSMSQKNNSVQEYCKEVYQHLSVILEKLSSMDLTSDYLAIMKQFYREKGLDTFVRGLRRRPPLTADYERTKGFT